MARSSYAFTSFVAGEVSPKLDGRTDLEKYYKGCKTLENMIVHAHGTASRRPGTRFASEVKNSSAKTRLIPFEFSTTQTYMLEFGNQYIRFYKDNGIITETGKTISAITKANPGVVTATSHGYSNGDYVILSGIVGMTELNGRQFKVASVSTHTFALQDMDGNNFDTSSLTTYASAGTAFKIYEIATTYATADLFELKFAQSADVMYITHPTYVIRKITRTGHTSWSIADVSISGSPSPNLNNASDNYPSCVTFFEQRLVFANTNNNPQTLWFSKSGDYENFTAGTDADDAMIFTIASNQVNAIRYLSASRSLLVGTVGGEFLVTGSDTVDGLSPTNINIRKQSTYGSANKDAISVGNVTLFLQRAKRKVRELVYNYDSDNYVAPDLTILSEHISKSTIVDMAYQQEPDSILWACRDDGILVGMTYQRTENVVAWHRHIIGGKSDTGKSVVTDKFSFSASSTTVSTTNNTITLSSHGMSTGDVVSYYADSNDIGGLKQGIFYFVIATDSNTIKLALTSTDATAGTAVSLTSAPGTATTQYIYKGVNVRNGTFYVSSHGFGNDTFIYYYPPNTNDALGGLTTNVKYFVDVITDNTFKISTSKNFNTYATITSVSTTAATHKWLTHAKVETVAVIPTDENEDQLYIIVNRFINGATRRYVEYLTPFDYGDSQMDAFYVDSGLTYSGDADATISGLDHLEGEPVDILINGAKHVNITVSSGDVALNTPAEKATMGLNYESILQTMRLEAGSDDGAAQGKIKRIHDVTIRLDKSLGCEVGGDLDNMEIIPFRDSSMLMGRAVGLFTGDKDAEFRGDYNKEGFVVIRQSSPLPLNVVAIYARSNTFDG
tara:strand:+ start:2056 stop:4584 length:2529 start_codon:yes stop_codon:yes gene_type:complete